MPRALFLLAALADPPVENPGRVEAPPATPRALAYYRTGNAWWAVNRAWEVALPAAVLASGLSARLRDAARRIGRRRDIAVGVFVALYLTLVFAASLPLAYWQGYIRPHAYGLSVQPFAKWLGDSAKAFAVTTALAAAVAWMPYRIMAWSPRRWWLWLGLLCAPVALILGLARPILFDPLFNRFGPLRDKALEAKIIAQAERAGIAGSRVFEVDKSRDTPALNAYVTGLGGTKRIVLWDTTLAAMGEREVLVILGHEMGHYALNHVVRGILTGSALLLVGLAFVAAASRPVLRRWGGRIGVERPDDLAALPLLLLLGHVAALALLPIGLAVGRQMEREADRFALELTRDNEAAASAFVKFQVENLTNPRPGSVYTALRASHPGLAERVEFCNTYRPWAEGRPLVYGHRFRQPDG